MMNPVRAESKAQHKAAAMQDAVRTGIFMKYLLFVILGIIEKIKENSIFS
jgi:hypothetical protein